MEDSSRENLTTRSLLKGILATEIVRPPIKTQTKRRVSRSSISGVRQEKIPASPSVALRSQMKAKVRRSLGKLALEDSFVKRNVSTNIKKKSVKEGFHNMVEELNSITPQTLLKKIIQNEDEVSIIVSQRSKAAAVDTEQESTNETKRSSGINVNLSLPDLQDTEHFDIFRISRKKKRVDVSQFEREVDKNLPKNRDNSSYLKENSFANASVQTRSFEDPLDFSVNPQSTYKRALLRKPNKPFLVSLGDFEQGVENKYQLLKGSQECFVESLLENKSSISAQGVAELNTELYVPPSQSEMSTVSSPKHLKTMSNSLVSSDNKRHKTGNMSLERTSINISNNFPSEYVLPSIERLGTMKEKDILSFPENIRKSVPMVEVAEHSDTNPNLQKSLQVGEEKENVELDQQMQKSLSVVTDTSSSPIHQEQATNKSVSMKGATHIERHGISKLRRASTFDLDQRRSKSFVMDKDGTPNKSYPRMQQSELVEGNAGVSESDGSDDREMMETDDRAGHEHLQSISSETEENQENNKLHSQISHSENGNQYTKSLNSLSRQEDISEFSQDSSKNTVEGEHEESVKLFMNSAVMETPAYMKNTKFTIPPYKLAAGKPIERETGLKTKKDVSKNDGSSFKASLVKQLFTHHAKMRVTKEASADVQKVMEAFLDQMTGDLATYAAHANRKTITRADLELLMKRQRLVTDTASLNLLIERHLPLECRKLLIPCAMTGNQVFPKMSL